MKKQKKDKRRQSTQQLMGIKKITDYCITCLLYTSHFIAGTDNDPITGRGGISGRNY